MSYINVVDIESTCWQDDAEQAKNVSEIIEIGIVQLNLKTLGVSKKESICVIPTESEVSGFCTELTGWTEEALRKDGMTFVKALERLRLTYNSRYITWASYGDYDRSTFVKQCQRRQLDYPFGNQHINVKAIMKSAFTDVGGLGTAVEKFGMTFKGRQHNGADDAENIARVYSKLLKNIRGEI